MDIITGYITDMKLINAAISNFVNQLLLRFVKYMQYMKRRSSFRKTPHKY